MQPSDNQQNEQPPQGQGFYHPTAPSEYPDNGMDAGAPPAPTYDTDEQVTWEASEYIHRNKDASWAIIFVVIVVIVLGIVLWIHEWLFAVLLVTMASAMGYFAFRPPQTKHYTLTHEGLKVDDKMYYLTDYRAFGVMAEDAFYYIMMLPTGRFKPSLTIYFAENDGEKIIDILSAHLPMEELKPDVIDIVMRRLHF
jgi:hypothetical protein